MGFVNYVCSICVSESTFELNDKHLIPEQPVLTIRERNMKVLVQYVKYIKYFSLGLLFFFAPPSRCVFP